MPQIAPTSLNATLANTEMGVTPSQTTTTANSSFSSALASLSATDKGVLKQQIANIRGQVVSALDAVTTRILRVNYQITALGTRMSNSTQGTRAYNSFYNAFSKAITSDPSSAALAVTVLEASSEVNEEKLELSYQLTLAQTQLAILTEESQQYQQALNMLDQVVLSIS